MIDTLDQTKAPATRQAPVLLIILLSYLMIVLDISIVITALPGMPILLRSFESSSMDDSLRIHVPRQLQGIYDIRNRRGVGHLAGRVSANKPDAELLLTVSRWILAEVVRLFSGSLDYHVYARGHRREKIFIEQSDYAYFLSLLARYLSNEEA